MEIKELRQQLLADISLSDDPKTVLRDKRLRDLMTSIKSLSVDEKKVLGKSINELRSDLGLAVKARLEELESNTKRPIDVTAQIDINASLPEFLSVEDGSIHPLMSELDRALDIYSRMGFQTVISRELDDEFHMFSALNFPMGHPARDDYDSFLTTQRDSKGHKFVTAAHTSTMQHRVLLAGKHDLESGQNIASVIPGRVFRNEDVDARHEHTFYQLEGVFVSRDATVGNLISVLKTFFQEYFGKEMEIKTQPFYFPFTEPSFEFAVACPFCDKNGCHVCGEGWLELLGCGMIHPNVLNMAGIDPQIYTGFAWGGGIDRLVMIRHGIEDIRYFHSGSLEFLRQFTS